MRGRTLVLTGAVVLAAFAVALWYFQTRAYYRDLPPEPLTVQGTAYPVLEWQGIDADTSPLKRRVCLRVGATTAARIAGEQSEATGGEPLMAPGWFDCFDARQIARDLEAGRAELYATGTAAFGGTDEFLALYPDGRGYLWRQLRPEFRDR